MWKCLILLVVGLITVACGAGPSDVTGPPTDGTLVISTATGGDDPDQDGYVLVVDDVTSLTLHPTGTAEVDVPTGHHRLRLLGVAEQCSVVPDTSLQTVVPLRDTVEVHFSVTCEVPQGPPPQKSFGTVRISAPTPGATSSSAHYEVWYEHYGAWDYGGGPLTKLGELAPNDSLVAVLPASTQSGGDPYWYEFHLKGIPANCRAPGQSRFAISAGDTLDVEFAVRCSPPSTANVEGTWSVTLSNFSGRGFTCNARASIQLSQSGSSFSGTYRGGSEESCRGPGTSGGLTTGGSIENGVVDGSSISFTINGSPGSHFSGSVAADGMSMSGNGTMSAYFDDEEEVALSGTWTAVKQ